LEGASVRDLRLVVSENTLREAWPVEAGRVCVTLPFEKLDRYYSSKAPLEHPQVGQALF
jgi:hypothetical protein